MGIAQTKSRRREVDENDKQAATEGGGKRRFVTGRLVFVAAASLVGFVVGMMLISSVFSELTAQPRMATPRPKPSPTPAVGKNVSDGEEEQADRPLRSVLVDPETTESEP